MSDGQRTAVKSIIILVIAAAASVLTYNYLRPFFIPLMFVLGFLVLMAGAQFVESWQQKRKEGSGPKLAQRRREAQRRQMAKSRRSAQRGREAKDRREAKPGKPRGASVVHPVPDPERQQPGTYGMVPRIMLPGGGSDPDRPRRRLLARRDRGPEQLDPDATVTLAAEREETDVDELFDALNSELVGLVPVKRKIEEIAALLLVDRVRQKFGLEAPRPNLHMCFTGAPGTGKTTVALKMADLLHRLGYLEEGHMVHAMRNDLVGQYIGQTAPRTRRMLDRAMGGVLFIDEAYYLYRAADPQDFGQEAIDILLQVMENERDKLVVILAGYKDRMEEFFESNPGMRSRIAHHLDFAAYELDELVAIGRGMLKESRYYLSSDAEVALREYLTRQMQQAEFANARSVRNEMERARLQHAHRLATDLHRAWSRDDLMRLEAGDIWAADVLSLSNTVGTARQRVDE
jgi:probable Rubsico expression protein CbbX